METFTAPFLPQLWRSTLISGILSVILGVAVLAWPGKTLLVAAVFFGVYLLVSGIAQVVFAFGLHITAGARVLAFISGAASLILAVLAFRHFGQDPTVAIWLLAIWIGIGFIFRGTATTVAAVSDSSLPGRGWTIFIGVMSLLAGVIMLALPFESIAILTLVAGIWLIIIGSFEILGSFSMRSAAKQLDRALNPR